MEKTFKMGSFETTLQIHYALSLSLGIAIFSEEEDAAEIGILTPFGVLYIIIRNESWLND